MPQENKELLLIDLSTRLPYGVKGVVTYDKSNTTFTVEGFDDNVLHLSYAEECYVEDFKPYLRPMSSMTEEEDKEYTNIDNRSYSCPKDYAHIPASDRIDWLNKKMFDYRGLIDKGLALQVLEGMYD